MKEQKILQRGAPVLRQIAKEVKKDEFDSPELEKILAQMENALTGEDDGVALAAPQIGVAKRIFIISPRAYKDKTGPLVFINPKITKKSKEKRWMEEGCLSVRPWYGETRRHEKTTVEAQDRSGRKFTWGGSGLTAQIFQHEIDHLNGILFSDHAKNLREYNLQEIEKRKNELEKREN